MSAYFPFAECAPPAQGVAFFSSVSWGRSYWMLGWNQQTAFWWRCSSFLALLLPSGAECLMQSHDGITLHVRSSFVLMVRLPRSVVLVEHTLTIYILTCTNITTNKCLKTDRHRKTHIQGYITSPSAHLTTMGSKSLQLLILTYCVSYYSFPLSCLSVWYVAVCLVFFFLAPIWCPWALWKAPINRMYYYYLHKFLTDYLWKMKLHL